MTHFVARAFKRGTAVFPNPPEEPIRAELFSVERLEQHGESLAAAQRIVPTLLSDRRLTRRLRDNDRVLRAAYQTIALAVSEERTITPAADWLVDNFHVVDEQVYEIRRDLPRGFYRQLPKLADGPLKAYPRVFGLAWAFVAHTDSRFDPQILCSFIRAYQRVEPLTIGELWAVAITLRVVLVENLRRLAEGIVARRAAREIADALANRLLGIGAQEAEPASIVLKHLDGTTLPTAFVVQLVQRLRDQDPRVMPALHWLDKRLEAQGKTADDLVQEEHQRQGATNVTVRNVITSMRLMSGIDWKELFESVSLVDEVLRDAGDFAALDFSTRDLYRRALEELARGSTHSEIDVARLASVAAKEAGGVPSKGADVPREQDPGHYLIGKGRPAFERGLGFRVPIRKWLARANTRAGIWGYLAIIATVVIALIALLLSRITVPGGYAVLCGFALLALLPSVDAAVALVNNYVIRRFGAIIIPGLELADGVPSHLRTMVVIPTMLTSRAVVAEQVESLLVHHLANVDDNLCFALLSDWADAPTEHTPDDADLLDAAVAGIARLNRLRGATTQGERFFLLHRRRVWDETQQSWMGWERKRGKLHELNRLLRGATDTTFVSIDDRSPGIPAAIRYIITLDADTRLPRGGAKRLIGKMAHPLNRPVLDPDARWVMDGHAVLQPRVSPSMPIGHEGSFYQRVFSNASGLDPYAFAVSDVYQDLFGEGSYSGKGIYDIDFFETALHARIPPDRVLSHDLLEGIFARAGLVSDIEVVEEFPSRYDVAAARQHRWTRGDWQLLPWMFGRRGPVKEKSHHAAMPAIGRWKMIDNLRRSLSSPAAFAALLAGWTLPLAAAEVWSSFVLLAVAAPAMLPFVIGIVPRTAGISRWSRVRAIALDIKAASLQVALAVTLLPHQAWLVTDAIVRTLFRLFVSHRMLLEWITAAQAKIGPRLDLVGFYRQMAGAVALACGAVLLIAWARPSSLPLALPFVTLWLLSPAIARWVSLPPAASIGERLADPQRQLLRSTARRTWRFFDTFVTAADHMLPPDNFQEDPAPVLAHRTSPTNLGLYLLSVVAARDFGWIGTVETTTRLEATLESMNSLERFHGHFYNWYGTLDRRPLEPKYISSVDSGNLAGHLIALWNACAEMATRSVMGPQCLQGIADALDLMRQSPSAVADESEASLRKLLNEALDVLSALLRDSPATAMGMARRLHELAAAAQAVADRARALVDSRGKSVAAAGEWLVWANAIDATLRSHREDLNHLMPWAEFLAHESDAIASNGTPLASGKLGILLAGMPALADLPRLCEAAVAILACPHTEGVTPHSSPHDALIDAFKRSADAAVSLTARLAALGEVARGMFFPMEFDFLFDRKRELLSIGYQVAEGCLDPSYYDLLASEARLASFVAIAKGDIPTRHWFRLGRALAPVGSRLALVSWSGSMFEYLMPSLVMRAAAGSLLEQTSRQVVQRQIAYGAERGVPWGVSESAFNARDLELTYQYSSFGIPDLGLKRGLGDNIVIAPYATALAAMVDPAAALKNFERLAQIGGKGPYGWYDALDYTKTRLPEGAGVAIVRAYMAHHQGMSVVAIADTLHGGAMRARFHAEPIIRATELLLQERMPSDVAIFRPRIAPMDGGVVEPVSATQRRFTSPHDLTPRTHLLSNGRYSVMMTAAGSGYSRWGNFSITRWREDVTCDGWGTYIFLRDTRGGALWSAGYQPSGAAPDLYNVAFSEGRAEIVRHDEVFTTTLEVLVSSEDDAEVRRVSLTNLGSHVREIELTSYAELVLAPRADDDAHPAFSKLFVETEFVAEVGAILATRRPRSPGDARIWVAHLAVVEGETVGDVQFETDRARFLGRGRGIRRPLSMVGRTPLSNTAGTVLDPVISLRRRVRIQPQATVRVAFWTLVASSRSEALDLVDKHHEAMAFERAGMLSWTQAQVQLHHLGITAGQAHVFQRLANRVLYADPTLRPPSDTLKRGGGAAPMLWPHGISGDLPIVLVRIDEVADIDIVRELLLAHEYWRLKLLSVDLVILNDRSASYVQDLQIALEALVRAVQSRPTVVGDGVAGAVFILRSDRIAPELRQVLHTAARVVLVASRGSLDVQVTRVAEPQPAVAPPGHSAVNAAPRPSPPQPGLEFFNGLGGFADNGREYKTVLEAGQSTPAPWINVVCNPSFGFQCSAEGSGYTWSLNSQQNHLTPWYNDPVTDAPGETLYLRDEDSGELWGPTALPIRVSEARPMWRGTDRAIAVSSTPLTAFRSSSCNTCRSMIRSRYRGSRSRIMSGRARHLSVTAYVEWVLGASRGASAPFIVTEIDAETGAMLARNPWNAEFGQRVAFVDLAGRQMSWTGDRTVFLGRNGTLDQPAALAGAAPLSMRIGAGLDPCGALQTRLDLEGERFDRNRFPARRGCHSCRSAIVGRKNTGPPISTRCLLRLSISGTRRLARFR